MQRAFQPLSFTRGPAMKNRFMLAPLTNTQSHDDGTLSEDEFHWLTLRAKGGFGLTMTCAAHVQEQGRGFPGQLGVFSNRHIKGLSRLAKAIKAEGSLAVIQLHHAGMRSPAELIGQQPICPSRNEETGAREMTRGEVDQLVEDFVLAAQRAELCGFDGVELHGAHGYVLSQFLSSEINHRSDDYGGSLENRCRIVVQIIDGIRARCGDEFNLGLRLSPERFGLKLDEIRTFAQQTLNAAQIDYLDMSLWDVYKEPAEEVWQGRTLLSYFTELERGDVRLGAAGKISRPSDVEYCLEAGCDYVMLGRAAILQHDFPNQLNANPDFEPVSLPVTRDYLRAQGLGEKFLEYMSRWPDFVSDVSA